MSNVKFQIEFVLRSSPKLLYNYISTPSGLAEWFADNVNARTDKFVFIWDDSEEIAYLLTKKQDRLVKFRWDEKDEDTFWEMKIEVDELTKDLSLIVTDFADDDEEVEESKMFWENQISELKHVIGS
ncbi:MAG: SRPBCC domain-containing protein [Flavobacteriales bacterium]|nr:SRPBCC domain-containing protein [Flavobacteriales bacterium]